MGGDRNALGGQTGAIIDAQGYPLVSTDTNSETALLFGPSALREIQAGVANGDFASPPPDTTVSVSDSNRLPYWTFTDVDSSGSITAAVIADSTVASGNVLRFTIASGTPTGKSATLTRFIAIPSSASRSFSVYAEASLFNAANSYEATVKLTGQFYKNDLTTTTGSPFNSATTTFQQFVTVYGLNAPDLYAIAPDLTTMTAPADAAFCKLTLTIATATLAVSNVARTGTTATITTSTFHNYTAGQSVTIALTSGPTGYAALNGTWTITAPVTSNTFTFTTVTSGTITSGAAVGTASSPSTVARTIDLTEVRLASGLPELLLTDKESPATYAPGLISEESGYMYLTSGSQDYLSVGANMYANTSSSINLNTGGTVSTNAAAVNLTATNGVNVYSSGSTPGAVNAGNVTGNRFYPGNQSTRYIEDNGTYLRARNDFWAVGALYQGSTGIPVPAIRVGETASSSTSIPASGSLVVSVSFSALPSTPTFAVLSIHWTGSDSNATIVVSSFTSTSVVTARIYNQTASNIVSARAINYVVGASN